MTGDEVATILQAAFVAKVKRLRLGDLYVEFDGYVETQRSFAASAALDPDEQKQRQELAYENEMNELMGNDFAEWERRMQAQGGKPGVDGASKKE